MELKNLFKADSTLIFEKWEDIKLELKNSMDMTIISYHTWIKPLKIAEINGKNVRIQCEIPGAVEYIQRKYKNKLETAIRNVIKEEYRVEIFA